MRRINRRLATACTFAVATALFTGAALAGNGKDTAPGQTKKDEAAAQVTVAVTAQTQVADESTSQGQSGEAQASAPGQVKKSEASTSASTQSSTSTSSNGQLQQSGNASPAVAGMKPSTNTGHWTTCGATGGTSTAATCPAGANETAAAQAKTDSSKRYGNSQTAAEIAVSRGGTGVTLTGPGNSQPHKVSSCLHASNPSGGVDVHAIKSYNSASCAPAQTTRVVTSSVCGSTSVTTITTTSQAALHGKGKHLGKGIAKQQVGSTSSSTVVTPTGEVCVSSSTPPGQVTTPPGQVMTPPAAVPPATVVTPATAPGTTAAPTTNAGSVAGTQTALSTPKTKHAKHGVLGTVTRVSGSTLPFTGFPLWMALAAALGLIVTGSALRRRGSAHPVR
jgi:hypothetical protein